LDEASLALTRQYDEIVYISCNPAKLNAELALFNEHKIVSAALFDQVGGGEDDGLMRLSAGGWISSCVCSCVCRRRTHIVGERSRPRCF